MLFFFRERKNSLFVIPLHPPNGPVRPACLGSLVFTLFLFVALLVCFIKAGRDKPFVPFFSRSFFPTDPPP